MTGYTLAVGQLYDPSRRSYPTTEQVRIDRTLAELIRFWPDPSAEEIAAHDRGSAQFALIDESPDLAVLAYQYGDLSWSDAPFQAHRLTTSSAGWPRGGPEQGLLFRTILVDASTGVVMSLRYDPWSPEFANAVRVAVAEQLIHELDEGAAESRLNALYTRYESPAMMVRSRAVSTCRSSEPAVSGTSGVEVHHY